MISDVNLVIPLFQLNLLKETCEMLNELVLYALYMKNGYNLCNYINCNHTFNRRATVVVEYGQSKKKISDFSN